MFRSLMNGMILNLQLFTSIPINNYEVDMNNKNIKRAVQLFPLLGFLQGAFLLVLFYLLDWFAFFSPLAIAFFLWSYLIVITGGIHLDGWIDSCDAFFSYRDKKRRVEILADPRIGAFGLIGAIVLLSARFLFIYETILYFQSDTYILLLFIPVFGKMFMGLLLTMVKPAKGSGIGYLFHQASDRKTFIHYMFYLVVPLLFIALYDRTILLIVFILFATKLISYFILKQKVETWFGGINGDIVGGATEGVETLLWMTVWLYHCYVMAPL